MFCKKDDKIQANSIVFYFYLCYLFIFDCAGSSLLHRPFSHCGDWGLLSNCSAQASPSVASLVVEHRL